MGDKGGLIGGFWLLDEGWNNDRTERSISLTSRRAVSVVDWVHSAGILTVAVAEFSG